MSDTPTTSSEHRRSPIQRRIDQQRVQLWYGWLYAMSEGASSYALEKTLIPEGFVRTAEGGLSHRNRMARYAHGKHVPRAALVERAEQHFPGSRALLQHPYWSIIDPLSDVQAHGTAWLMALGTDVRRILFTTHAAASELMLRRRRVTRVTLRQLENRGTFEALAAVALLLREAQQAGNTQQAFDYAGSFWRILLLIISSIPFFTHLNAMAKLAGDALLDHVVHRGERVAIARAPIRICEDWLRSYCLAREDEGRIKGDWRSWVRERLLLIRGTKGFDLLHALQLPTVATEELKEDATRHQAFLRDQYVRYKAWDYLSDPRWAARSFTDDIIAFLGDPEGRWPTLD